MIFYWLVKFQILNLMNSMMTVKPNTKQKDNALRLALTHLAGEFGRESMLSLQRFFNSRRAPVISTGSLKLDLALGS